MGVADERPAKSTAKPASAAKVRKKAAGTKTPPDQPLETAPPDESAPRDETADADRPASRWPADDDTPVRKTNKEWKQLLTPKQYRVTRLKQTETPYMGKYARSKKHGTYRCVCCGAKLFDSSTKFESGTGWPSFWAPLGEQRIKTAPDFSENQFRQEVQCARCDAHLGHVFDDGPAPTGLRYCLNSAALVLEERKGEKGRRGE